MAQTPHHAFTQTISVVMHEFQIFLWGSSWSSTTNYALHYGLHVQIGKTPHLVHFFAIRMDHIQFQCLLVPWICCKNGSVLGFRVLECCVGIHKMFSNPYGKHVKFCIKQGMNLKAIEQNSMLKHWYILCSKCFL
jgi:hypothetical protein